MSLAHNGLLLLDEPAEFDSRALVDIAGAAREGGVVCVAPSGAGHAVRYPARFQLIVTSRPEDADRGLRRASALFERCAMEIAVADDPGAPGRTFVESAERVGAARRRLDRRPPAAPGAGFDPLDATAKEIARTIAALDGCGEVGRGHLEEAVALARAGDGRP